MNLRYERRSTEAPMDFEFTNKDRNVIGEDSPFHTPLKRMSVLLTLRHSFLSCTVVLGISQNFAGTSTPAFSQLPF